MRLFRLSSRSSALLFAAVCLPPPAAVRLEPFPKPITLDEAAWAATVGAAEADVEFLPPKLPHGATLRFGPWHEGSQQVRLKHVRKLVPARGMVRGLYKTSSALLFGAVARVTFLQGTKPLAERRIYLEPSASHRYFELPIRGAPVGSDGFSLSFGLEHQGQAVLELTDLSFSPDSRVGELVDCGLPVAPRRLPPPALAASEHARLGRAGDSLWFVAPSGQPFFLAGLDVSVADRTASGLAVLKELVSSLQPNALGNFHNWPYWSARNEAFPDQPLYLLHRLDSGSEFPDPYDPQFALRYRAQVREVARAVGSSPYFVGYVADKRLELQDWPQAVWSSHAGQAFLRHLRVRYARIEELNQAWSTKVATFEDLLVSRPHPGAVGRARRRDFDVFWGELLARYAQTMLEIIRQEDPKRLALAPPFYVGSAASQSFSLLLPFGAFDALTVELEAESANAGLSRSQAVFLEQLHSRTGRPLLAWGLRARPEEFAGYPQETRVRQLTALLGGLYNLPYVVGVTFGRDVPGASLRELRRQAPSALAAPILRKDPVPSAPLSVAQDKPAPPPEVGVVTVTEQVDGKTTTTSTRFENSESRK